MFQILYHDRPPVALPESTTQVVLLCVLCVLIIVCVAQSDRRQAADVQHAPLSETEATAGDIATMTTLPRNHVPPTPRSVSTLSDEGRASDDLHTADNDNESTAGYLSSPLLPPEHELLNTNKPDVDSRFKVFLHEPIGTGATGTVYRGLDTMTGQVVACKHVNGASVGRREFAVLQSLCHVAGGADVFPRPLAMMDSKSTTDDVVVLVMEYVSGGSLANLLGLYHTTDGGPPKGLPLPLVSKYTRELLLALNGMHKIDMVHGDIKPANLLVSHNGSIKLCDFDTAIVLHTSPSHPSAHHRLINDVGVDGVGGRPPLRVSLPYVAPEVVRTGQISHSSSDIWSVGCSVLQLATGEIPWGTTCDVPYQQHSPMEMVLRIGGLKDGHHHPPLLSRYLGHWPAELASFVTACLSFAPQSRPTAEALLQHPFVSSAYAHQPTAQP